ncbi:TPA: hypothetical protein DCE37_26545 [Candidatus Latescibacteria bacterium]|nr:hypothetical protein [Gemmatimonadota bacterium]HAA78673.1 hypothetical protein [Candidatus Latescibacterota bacterium]
MDVQSLDSVKASVERARSSVDRIDVLINNAGVNSLS